MVATITGGAVVAREEDTETVTLSPRFLTVDVSGEGYRKSLQNHQTSSVVLESIPSNAESSDLRGWGVGAALKNV